jgi:hypothetical protein
VPTAEGVEAPQTEGRTPWPTGLHAAEKEKKRKKEEEKEKKEEETKDGEKEALPSPGQLDEGVPALSPWQQQQQQQD